MPYPSTYHQNLTDSSQFTLHYKVKVSCDRPRWPKGFRVD